MRAVDTSVIIAALPSAEAKETSGEERAEMAGQSLVGSFAPKVVLKTIDGQVIDLGKLYGNKAVYLKFWATWCVPCREQMPHFEHIYETAGPDLAVIADYSVIKRIIVLPIAEESLAKLVKWRKVIWMYSGSPLAERRLGSSFMQPVDGRIALGDCN